MFKEHKDQPDSGITDDYVMDKWVWYGSVNKIVDHILAMREEIVEPLLIYTTSRRTRVSRL